MGWGNGLVSLIDVALVDTGYVCYGWQQAGMHKTWYGGQMVR